MFFTLFSGGAVSILVFVELALDRFRTGKACKFDQVSILVFVELALDLEGRVVNVDPDV